MMQELNYIRCGDYYIPDIRLPEETRPIGRWGRMHRDYIKEHNPIRFNALCLNGELWSYLADLNEQAQSRLELIIEQMLKCKLLKQTGLKKFLHIGNSTKLSSILKLRSELLVKKATM